MKTYVLLNQNMNRCVLERSPSETFNLVQLLTCRLTCMANVRNWIEWICGSWDGEHIGDSADWDLPTCQTDRFSFDLFDLKISYIVSATTIAKQNSLLKKGKHWADKDYLSERAIVIIVSCICPKHVLIRCRHAWTWNWKEDCERNGKEQNVRRCANRADLLEHVRRHSTVNFATSNHETIFFIKFCFWKDVSLNSNFSQPSFERVSLWSV